MTRIILTRHGHVDWIAPERFRGRAELELSDLGQRQARKLADRIAMSWQPSAIYTSPLSRGVDTGTEVAAATGATAEARDGLQDIDYGKWQGLTHDEVSRQWQEQHHIWLTAPDFAEIPGGESLADVLARGTRLLADVLQRHANNTVVLVGHDSINRVLLLQMLGLPLSCYWRLKQEPCCINEITHEDGLFTFHRLNETYHLIEREKGS